MTPMALLIFAGVYALAVLSPGPGVAAVVARALATGHRRTIPFILGIVLGDFFWFGLVVSGLTVLAQNFYIVFAIVKYAGAAYLLYLAWKLWRAPAAAPEAQDYARGEGLRLGLAGFSMTVGNPKTMIFFLAILPQVVVLEEMHGLAIVELCLLMAVILFAIMMIYAVLAAKARAFIGSPRQMKMVNRATGGLMAGVAVAVATR
ncbi:LysE family translocator [Dongia sp.]|uniref:LysE family translocator n=1 Tax=Dongia sp. TaxID=1977262 RepID=UPI0035B0A7C5